MGAPERFASVGPFSLIRSNKVRDDLVAKTPVAEIHIYDGDVFLQHNAFRSPGATSLEELQAAEPKVARHERVYRQMHLGVMAHPYTLTASNVHELASMDFVFLCLDAGSDKKATVDDLVRNQAPLVDVGLGVSEVDGALGGLARTTTYTPDHSQHLEARTSLADGEADDEYGQNIQIAELSALNAALAVIRWKKYAGFYADTEREHSSTYATSGNQRSTKISHEDLPARAPVRGIGTRGTGLGDPVRQPHLQHGPAPVLLRVPHRSGDTAEPRALAADRRRRIDFSVPIGRQLAPPVRIALHHPPRPDGQMRLLDRRPGHRPVSGGPN